MHYFTSNFCKTNTSCQCTITMVINILVKMSSIFFRLSSDVSLLASNLLFVVVIRK